MQNSVAFLMNENNRSSQLSLPSVMPSNPAQGYQLLEMALALSGLAEPPAR